MTSPIQLIIEPREGDIDGFAVRRVLPFRKCRSIGPFVFFDQMGPSMVTPDKALDVRPHPHIGLATLTWMIKGVIMHRDSLGFSQEIKAGEVNWMTAGAGIVHSERTPEWLRGFENPLFGLQIWMALPKAYEECAPSFQHYRMDQIPQIDREGVKGTLVAGSLWGLTSPVAVYSDTLYVDIRLAPGASITLGSDHEERALYALSGAYEVNGQGLEPLTMAVVTPGVDVEIVARDPLHLIIIGGEKLDGSRHMWWNFVSSDKERIEQAKRDWRAGQFAKVVDDEDEFTPLPA